MSNLENLVKKITNDSNSKAKSIVDEANLAAEKVINAKIEVANQQKEQILANAKIESSREKEQIISGKKLSIRDNKLLAKQKVINDTFKLAIGKLKELSFEEYENFLVNYLVSLNISGDEELVIPKKYQSMDINALNQKLSAKNINATLKFKQDAKEIDGGFVLIRGGIENNNTFESLLDYYRDELEPVVVENLF